MIQISILLPQSQNIILQKIKIQTLIKNQYKGQANHSHYVQNRRKSFAKLKSLFEFVQIIMIHGFINLRKIYTQMSINSLSLRYSLIDFTFLQKRICIISIFLNICILIYGILLPLSSIQFRVMQGDRMKQEEMDQSSIQETQNKHKTTFQGVNFITGDEAAEIVQKLDKLEIKCYRAIQIIKQGTSVQILAEKLNITLLAAKKISIQFNTYGKVYLPRGPKPTQFENSGREDQKYEFSHFENAHHNQQGFIQLNGPAQKYGQMPMNGSIGFNTKLPNQKVEQIKRILLKVIKQDRMQSYEQMKQHLQTLDISRSLSSIYRHVNSLKSTNPELQNRNFAMYKKDIFGSAYSNITSVKETQK